VKGASFVRRIAQPVSSSGWALPVGDLDSLVDALRLFDQNRHRLPAMGRAARQQAELCTWERHRRAVTEATEGSV